MCAFVGTDRILVVSVQEHNTHKTTMNTLIWESLTRTFGEIKAGSVKVRQILVALASSQKPSRGVSLYSRFVNRPAGRLLAAFCYRVGLSPNGVTTVSGIVTAIGMLVIVCGDPAVLRGLLGMLLLVAGFAFDSADGQLARLTGRGSPAGEWLDHVVDAGKIVVVHSVVVISVFRFSNFSPWLCLAPMCFAVVSVVIFVGGLLTDLLTRNVADTVVSRARPSNARAFALLPADYGILALSFTLYGWFDLFTVVYVVLLIANLLIMVILLIKWFRHLSGLKR